MIMNEKKLYRIYREEGLSVRRKRGRKRARGSNVLFVSEQDVPDLPCAIELAVVFSGSIDLGAEISIRFCPRGGTISIVRDGAPLIIGGLGDLQHFSHRLDPQMPPMFFNESSYLRNGRSSSA